MTKIDDGEIDRAARYLREKTQSGRFTVDWDRLSKVSKKKWLALAEGALLAARKGGEE